jgi:transposase
MLKKEEWLLIQVLHSKGFCISEIARQIDHDRKTVRKYLNLKTQPEPYKRLTRPSKLDPYKPYILKRINEDPCASACLYREIQNMGFDGGETIVKEFVKKAKSDGNPGITPLRAKI